MIFFVYSFVSLPFLVAVDGYLQQTDYDVSSSSQLRFHCLRD